MKQKNREGRPVMLFYESFEEAINDVYKSDKAMSADLYSAVVRYGLYGEEPQLTGIAATLWKLMLPTLKNGRDKAEAGRAGGKAKKRNNPNGRRGKTASEPEALDGSAKEEKKATPKPHGNAAPTLDSIRRCIEENRFDVDAEDFYDYYASRNWEVEGRRIGNIPALLRKWHEGGEWQKDYHENRFLYGDTERPPHLTPNERKKADAKLPVTGAQTGTAGPRTNGSSKVAIPQGAQDAPPLVKFAPMQGYIVDNGLEVDAQEFYDYYSARGWKVNGKVVKNTEEIKSLLYMWHEKATGRKYSEELPF